MGAREPFYLRVLSEAQLEISGYYRTDREDSSLSIAVVVGNAWYFESAWLFVPPPTDGWRWVWFDDLMIERLN